MKLTYKKGREEAFSEKIEKRRLNKKTTVITLLAVGLLVLLMMSPLFNVRNIRVTGISQLTNEAVQRASGISEGINIFKISTEKAEKQLEATTIRLLKVEALIESLDDLDVFNLLYREGKDLKDISRLLHISPSKAYRHRKTILEVAAPLEP